MKKSIIILVLLAVLFNENLGFSQINKKVFYRNDRFVLEYTKQILPGDKFAVTGFKLYEFFDGKLVHSDSSNRNTILPTCKHFLYDHEGCEEGYSDEYSYVNYFIGSSINKKNVFILKDESRNGYYFSEVSEGNQTYYDDENYQKKYDLTQILFPDSVFISSRVKGSKNQQSFREDYKKLLAMKKSESQSYIENIEVESIENHLVFHPEFNKFELTERILNTSKIREDQTFDINGNVYKTVNLFGDTWMAENLKATHFQNGELIRKSANISEWSSLNSPSLTQGFDSNFSDSSYGYFYNGYAIVDRRNICPYGFFVPESFDVSRLYNKINTDGHNIRIKWNGNVKAKRYPRILAPIIETAGIITTGAVYGIAGAIDVGVNLTWATADLLILGPFLGWKKIKLYSLDPTSKKVNARRKIIYRAFPTFKYRESFHNSISDDSLRVEGTILTNTQLKKVDRKGAESKNLADNYFKHVNSIKTGYNAFSLFNELVDNDFNLIFTPGRSMTNSDYTRTEDEYSSYDIYYRRKYSHLDRLKGSDGKKLTNEFGFNLTNDNSLLIAENNVPSEEEGGYLYEEKGGLISYEIVLPFTNEYSLGLWGNLREHELQPSESLNYLLFQNRNGAKVRCVKY